MSLEEYIQKDFRNDKRQLKEVVDTIHDVVLIFQHTAEKISGQYGAQEVDKCDVTSWPYRITASGVGAQKDFSITTHGMIMLMLDAIRPDAARSVLIPDRFVPPKVKFQDKSKSSDHEQLKDTQNAARSDVAKSLFLQPDAQKWVSNSRSFGYDDPLTITWFVELAIRWFDRDDEENTKCIHRILQAADRALAFPLRTPSDPKFFDLTPVETTFKCHELPHPFIRLRYGHLLSVYKRAIHKYHTNWRIAPPSLRPLSDFEPFVSADWFERNLHQHLAYWGVHDPRFDAAQLTFSLEGLLQIGPSSLSPVTIEHVFDVLRSYQQRDPCWRPIAPFIATERGLALFPLSVEITNSILRSCEMLDANETAPRYFSRFEPQLRNYVSWLLARIERFSHKGKDVAGWHSDHVQERETIHLWQSSQVLLFLAHYASLLQRKIAADGLAEANITLRPHTLLEVLPTFWNEEPLTIQHADGGQTISCYPVLKDIKSDYIDPRVKDKAGKHPCSFMLYGPPGTGKTTVAEQAAVNLGWPLVIVTVSDFLAQGAAAMEARAKMIFAVLCEQQDTVILFDEIDQFLLDRSSQWYQAQDDVFKFMTPGMLTKLQDLRDAKRSLFIVATNYYERIDGAIKRRGRIDDHFLLSLPDWNRRRYFIAKFLAEGSKEVANDWTNGGKVLTPLLLNASAADAILSDDTKDVKDKLKVVDGFASYLNEALRDQKVDKSTVLYGYGDLRKLVPGIKKLLHCHDDKEFAATIKSKLSDVDASVELRAYRSRFCDPDGNLITDETPTEEFCLLTYLCGEVEANVESTLDKRAMRKAADSIKDNYESLKAVFELEVIKDIKYKGYPEGQVYSKVKNALAQAATLK